VLDEDRNNHFNRDEFFRSYELLVDNMVREGGGHGKGPNMPSPKELWDRVKPGPMGMDRASLH
jgi:hypothetical protein